MIDLNIPHLLDNMLHHRIPMITVLAPSCSSAIIASNPLSTQVGKMFTSGFTSRNRNIAIIPDDFVKSG